MQSTCVRVRFDLKNFGTVSRFTSSIGTNWMGVRATESSAKSESIERRG